MQQSRGWHYLLLTMAWAVVCLPNLGGPSLWDIDEGNNAEAAREMLLAGNWIVPHFNYELRFDKPPLLYWCQMVCYQTFGVHEFAARLPSALALLLLSLVVYELGRSLFRPTTGLLAGLGTPTCLLLWAAGHFANPDALLTLTLTLAFAGFWFWSRGVAWAALPMGVSVGLGVLAKGPIALVLPMGVSVLYLIWQGRPWTIFRPSLLLGFATWGLVAIPWYVWVSVETRGLWAKEFWSVHNQGRFLNTMESHGGPLLYYVPVLLLGLAPWSLFLVQALAQGIRESYRLADTSEPSETTRRRDALRYLLCWACVPVVFFSFSATKLPNYVLPIYPALMLLIADHLDRWRLGESWHPRWMPIIKLVCGGSIVVALVLPWQAEAAYPGMRWLMWMAVFPLATLALFHWKHRPEDRSGLLTGFSLLAILWTANLALGVADTLDAHKSVKPLVAELPADHLKHDIRLMTYRYSHPSLVFYSRRLVEPITEASEVLVALRSPQPTYLFLPRRDWDELQPKGSRPVRVLGSHHDFYLHTEIVLVTNAPADDRAAAR